MKTTTTLALVGGLAYLGFRAKQAAEQAALAMAANAPLPPPNSGPVVNGLSFYQLEGLGGFGSKLKKAVKKTTNVVSKISPSAAVVRKLEKVTNIKDPGDLLKKIDPVKNLHKSPLFSKTLLVRKLGPKGTNRNPAPAAPGQEISYQDANGNTVTKSQYDAIVSAVESGRPLFILTGWADPRGYIITHEEYELTYKLPHRQHVYQSPGIIPQRHQYDSQGNSIIPPSINQGTAPVTYTPQPNEELIINSSQESDWNSLPGTQHTADSSGSPGLPGGVTTAVSTPAAQEAGPAAPESNTGKLLVGTGIAAVAAYLAFA